jgi:hypothetical protein
MESKREKKRKPQIIVLVPGRTTFANASEGAK